MVVRKADRLRQLSGSPRSFRLIPKEPKGNVESLGEIGAGGPTLGRHPRERKRQRARARHRLVRARRDREPLGRKLLADVAKLLHRSQFDLPNSLASHIER